MSKVFFTTARSTKWDYSQSLAGRFERMLGESGLLSAFTKDEWVAVKTHFGAREKLPYFARQKWPTTTSSW